MSYLDVFMGPQIYVKVNDSETQCRTMVCPSSSVSQIRASFAAKLAILHTARESAVYKTIYGHPIQSYGVVELVVQTQQRQSLTARLPVRAEIVATLPPHIDLLLGNNFVHAAGMVNTFASERIFFMPKVKPIPPKGFILQIEDQLSLPPDGRITVRALGTFISLRGKRIVIGTDFGSYELTRLIVEHKEMVFDKYETYLQVTIVNHNPELITIAAGHPIGYFEIL